MMDFFFILHSIATLVWVYIWLSIEACADEMLIVIASYYTTIKEKKSFNSGWKVIAKSDLQT